MDRCWVTGLELFPNADSFGWEERQGRELDAWEQSVVLLERSEHPWGCRLVGLSQLTFTFRIFWVKVDSKVMGDLSE